MAGNDVLIAKAAKAFNKVRRRFTPASVEVLLLKPTTDAVRDYEVLWQTAENWFFDTSAKPPVLYIAETGVVLEGPMAEATNVQVGNNVFVMTPDDVTPPDELGGPRVFWTIVCDKFARRGQYGDIY